jgi:metal-dependent amidase/aminoacylase/carboxypeptidase family protein
MSCLARQKLNVRFRGRTAHASAYPHEGVNAADAMTVAQVAIGLLRQHIHPTDRIHGIITHAGDAPNVIPEHAAGEWYVSSATMADLAELYPRVRRCFEAGALATGAEVHFTEPGPAYSEFLHDPALVAVYQQEAEVIGRRFTPPDNRALMGSTDMANVSLAMPAIHPMLAIDTDGAVNHQPEFAAACVNASADRAVLDGGLAMARTAAVAASDPSMRTQLLARTYTSAPTT